MKRMIQELVKRQVLETGKLVGLTPTEKSVFLETLAHLRGVDGTSEKRSSAMARELGMSRQNFYRAQKKLAKAGLDFPTLLKGAEAMLSEMMTPFSDDKSVVSHDYKNGAPLPAPGGSVVSHDYKNPPEGENVVSHDYKSGAPLPAPVKSVVSHDYKSGAPLPASGESVVSHDYKKTPRGGMGSNIYYIYNNNILDNKNKSRESLRACACVREDAEGLSTPPSPPLAFSTAPTVPMPSQVKPTVGMNTPSVEEKSVEENPSQVNTPSKDEKSLAVNTPVVGEKSATVNTPAVVNTPSKEENPALGIEIPPFQPPSEERVMAECKRQGISEEEAKKFYLFNEQCGWRDGRGRLILNWRAALGLWIIRGVERLTSARGSGVLAGAVAGSSSATLEMRVGVEVD